MNTKKLDIFLFYNELELLKVRLEYLGPLVDQFIICEANVDFSGKSKDFILNPDLILTLPYAKKIIYHREFINLHSLKWLYKKWRYRNNLSRYLWKIQDAQRNSTLKPLKKFSGNDIAIFSDLDEFPSQEGLAQAILLLNGPNTHSPNAFCCDQTFYYYNLNNPARQERFYGSIICKLSELRKHLPHKLRSKKNDLPRLKNGGWHFSYFMSGEKILNKIYAISDVENLSTYKDMTVSEIQQKIEQGIDLYDRNSPLESSTKEVIPEVVLQALKKYLPQSIRSN
jgi:beta-1,4-mannosyl-glycoprotein beta-1,4-N-acetylglucosaminyltransferase